MTNILVSIWIFWGLWNEGTWEKVSSPRPFSTTFTYGENLKHKAAMNWHWHGLDIDMNIIRLNELTKRRLYALYGKWKRQRFVHCTEGLWPESNVHWALWVCVLNDETSEEGGGLGVVEERCTGLWNYKLFEHNCLLPVLLPRVRKMCQRIDSLSPHSITCMWIKRTMVKWNKIGIKYWSLLFLIENLVPHNFQHWTLFHKLRLSSQS